MDFCCVDPIQPVVVRTGILPSPLINHLHSLKDCIPTPIRV